MLAYVNTSLEFYETKSGHLRVWSPQSLVTPEFRKVPLPYISLKDFISCDIAAKSCPYFESWGHFLHFLRY